METQSRQKYTEAMIKRLPKKNQKYYALDSEVIGLRIYVQISGEKSFYLQRYLKEFKYSKKTKIGDFPAPFRYYKTKPHDDIKSIH